MEAISGLFRGGARVGSKGARIAAEAAAGAARHAGQTTHAAAAAEATALKEAVKEVPLIQVNSAQGWKATGATAAGGVAVAGITVGSTIFAYNVAKGDVKDAASALASGVKDAAATIGEGTAAAAARAKAAMAGIPLHPPKLSDIESMLPGTGLVYGFSALLATGVAIFVAYEVYRFSS